MSPEEIARRVIGRIEEFELDRDKSWRLVYYAGCLGDNPRNIFASPLLRTEVDVFFEAQRRLIADLVREIVTECTNVIENVDADADTQKRMVSAVLNRFGIR